MDLYETIARTYDGDYAVHRTPSGDVDFYVEEAERARVGEPREVLGADARQHQEDGQHSDEEEDRRRDQHQRPAHFRKSSWNSAVRCRIASPTARRSTSIVLKSPIVRTWSGTRTDARTEIEPLRISRHERLGEDSDLRAAPRGVRRQVAEFRERSRDIERDRRGLDDGGGERGHARSPVERRLLYSTAIELEKLVAADGFEPPTKGL